MARLRSLPADSPAVAADVAVAVAPATREVPMSEVFVFLVVAAALLVIVGIARRRIADQSAPPSLANGGDDGVFNPMFLDGGSSSSDMHTTHGDASHNHASTDSGSHHGGFDGGHFDGGGHH